MHLEMGTEQFISTFPLFVIGSAAVVSLISFRYHYPTVLKNMSLLWVTNFFIELAGHITKYYGIRNHWIYNILYWIMCLALAYLYKHQIKNEYVRRSINWFYFLFPIFIVVESFFFGVKDLQTPIIVVGGVFVIFLSTSYFRQLYMSEETERITCDPWFWFSFGFLIHYGGTIPFLGMLNYLWERYPLFTHFYYLYFSNSFTIFLNILIIVGFLCRRNYQKSH